MSNERPDSWVIVEVTTPKIGTIRKILCSYYGGYLGNDSWRISSGIVCSSGGTPVFSVTNHSGSIYTLYNSIASYRMSGLTSCVWAKMSKEAEENDEVEVCLYSYEEAVAYLNSIEGQK